MNDTLSFLLHIREASVRKPAFRFLAGLLLSAFSFLTGFLLAPALPLPADGVFPAVSPFPGGHPAPAVLSVLRCLFPSAAALLGIYAAAHTPWSAAVSGAVIGWRGICLGCAGALTKNGTLLHPGRPWVSALILYSAASVLMILLASRAYTVSLYLCRTYAEGDLRTFRRTAADWLRRFLTISGGVFVLGTASVLLMQGSY